MNYKYITLGLCVFLTLLSCGKGDDSPNNPTTPEPEKQLGTFNLVFPANNELCTESNEVNDKVEVEFAWNASENATGYELKVEATDSGNTDMYSVTGLTKVVALEKVTQYTWTVTAKLNDDTKVSGPWSFYSQGTAVENYAPFPAEITVTDNNNGTVTIAWTGADLDDDITRYDVYAGTDTDPALILENTEEVQIAAFDIVADTIYYIKVVTKDAANNTSTATKEFKF